ncbi:PAS domain S-box-containing protein [Catenuloplanes nepalensis]|uniref:PAS domain S-box-containing protein n=1 Tax=Catenuloplanes nepalensis TaxID=587533 RepID=A0ABT9MU71_9ACTN|nr:MEKHLA domain-containing protein [Catenuloplanes nepalensis]MDP9794938.1 PAS domain S-box-containing protein [Catenuloplanes nepalensis]
MRTIETMLADSFARVVGEPLLPDGLHGAAAASWLYEAPFGLLAQDDAADPLFVYANRTAQRLFGYGRDEFVGLPSRLSAAAQDRDARAAFMAAVRSRGFVRGYRGLRVTGTGRPFWIEDVTVWNHEAGQAALIPRWAAVDTGVGALPESTREEAH